MVSGTHVHFGCHGDQSPSGQQSKQWEPQTAVSSSLGLISVAYPLYCLDRIFFYTFHPPQDNTCGFRKFIITYCYLRLFIIISIVVYTRYTRYLSQLCTVYHSQNAVLIGGSRLDFISPTNISMFCDRTTSITMATSTVSSIPMTTAYIPTTTTPITTPTTTPTIPPILCDTSKEEMCLSLYSLRNQTLSSPGTKGNCSVSDDCTSLSCSLTVTYSGFNVPLSLTTTLLPCSVPYQVHLAVSSPLLGEVVNDHFTESRTITITVLGINADVIVTITQQCFGVTISVSCCCHLLLFTLVYHNLLLSTLVYHNLLLFTLVYYNLLLFMLVYHDLLLLTLVYHNLLLFTLVHYNLLLFRLVYHNLMLFTLIIYHNFVLFANLRMLF